MSEQAKTFAEWWRREGLAYAMAGGTLTRWHTDRLKYLCAVAFVSGEIAAAQRACEGFEEVARG